MGKKRLLFLLLAGGILLIIGGWIFLYSSLTKNPENLQADIGQNPLANDGLNEQNNPSQGEDTNKINSPKETSKIEIEKTEIGTSLDDAIEQTTKQLATITIIVPPHIDNQGLQQLRKEIYKTHKVLGEFEQYKTFQAYQEALVEQQRNPSADIILIPSNRFDSYINRGAYIPSKQPISQLFHISVKELIEHPTTTFIPFSLDPYITIYDKSLSLPKRITIGNIQQQLLLLTAKERFPVPISFGINDQDLFLIGQEKQAYPEYFDIIERIIEQAAHTRNTYSIEYFLQALGRNTKTLLVSSKQQAENDTACMTFPHICLLKHQEIGISFGRFSSLALGKQLFDRDYSQTHTIANFPVDDDHYPMTSRGFVVNKRTTHSDAVIARLRGYLEHAGYSNMSLRPYTLSVFNHVYQQQQLQEPWVDLLKNIKNSYIVQGSIDDLQQAAKNEKLKAMLAGEYSKVIYIQEYLNNK